MAAVTAVDLRGPRWDAVIDRILPAPTPSLPGHDTTFSPPLSLSHSDVLFPLISSPLFIVMHCPPTYKDFSQSVGGRPTRHLLRNLVHCLSTIH